MDKKLIRRCVSQRDFFLRIFSCERTLAQLINCILKKRKQRRKEMSRKEKKLPYGNNVKQVIKNIKKVDHRK